jgi:hypothetical protein
MVGLLLLFLSDFPWLALACLLFVLVGMLGWAMEDPHAHRRLESPISQISTMKLEAPVSEISTMKLEVPVSQIPTAKIHAVQARIQERAVHPVASGSTPVSPNTVKEADGDPATRRDHLGVTRFLRF